MQKIGTIIKENGIECWCGQEVFGNFVSHSAKVCTLLKDACQKKALKQLKIFIDKSKTIKLCSSAKKNNITILFNIYHNGIRSYPARYFRHY